MPATLRQAAPVRAASDLRLRGRRRFVQGMAAVGMMRAAGRVRPVPPPAPAIAALGDRLPAGAALSAIPAVWVVSPWSVHAMRGRLALGARSDAADEFVDRLGHGYDVESLLAGLALARDALSEVGPDLKQGSAAWSRAEAAFLPAWRDRAERAARAGVGHLDFASVDAATTITRWVRHAAQRRIETQVGRVAVDIVFLLQTPHRSPGVVSDTSPWQPPLQPRPFGSTAPGRYR